MTEALSFLMSWVHDNINPTVYNDKAGAEYLAEECLRDAKKVGFQEADLNTAARRDLARFMLTHLNRAVVHARRASPRRSDHNNRTVRPDVPKSEIKQTASLILWVSRLPNSPVGSKLEQRR